MENDKRKMTGENGDENDSGKQPRGTFENIYAKKFAPEVKVWYTGRNRNTVRILSDCCQSMAGRPAKGV